MKTFFAILLLAMTSCINPIEEEKRRKAAENEKPGHVIVTQAQVDSRVNDIYATALYDTVGSASSPIQVLSYKLVEKEYSNYKDVSLTYKNVSSKPVAAVRFRWHGLNAFGEPADMGGSVEGFGAGFDDNTINPGKKKSGTWSISSRDAKTITKAWPYEIVFSDGTKWKSK